MLLLTARPDTSASRFTMKIFSIARLKTAAIARAIFHGDWGCVCRYKGQGFLPSPDPSHRCRSFLRSSIFFCPCTSCRHFEFIVLRRLYHFCCFRDLLSYCHFLYVCTYLCVLWCCFYRIKLCPSALFVRLCTLLIRAANRIHIRLNLSLLADVSLYPGICARHRKRFSFTVLFLLLFARTYRAVFQREDPCRIIRRTKKSAMRYEVDEIVVKSRN